MAAHETGRRVHLVGDGKEMLSLARAAERLQAGKPAGYPELVACSAWEQVVDYAEHDPAGSDLAVAVRMIERYGTDGVIAAIDGTVPARNADLVVSIAHRSKGLEWSRRGCGSPTTTASRSTSRPVVRFPSRSLMSCSPTCRSPLDVGGLGWVHDHLAALDTPPTPSAPAAAPDPAKAPEPPAQASVPFGVKVGDEVLVAGEHGTFKVTVVFRDGSYEAYATNGAGGARSFQPEWCTPAWKQSSRSA